MNKMENEKQKKNYSITSKGVELQVSELSPEVGDEFELFKAGTLTKIIGWRAYARSLEFEETQSESEINIKDKTINTLTELLRNKEKIIKKMRFEISQKNNKIDDLQTTQKLKLEKTIEDNTIEIRALKETINRYQEIIRPPSLTQEDIERYLSRFITEAKD